MTVELKYGVTFGKLDSSDWFKWEIDLTSEEEIAYNNAVENEILLEEVAELEDALRRAYDEIEAVEISNYLDYGNEYVMECQGEIKMDYEELNKLIDNRDSHALAFFGLTEATDEELEKWDAYDLDEVPLVKDFVEGFEPHSPFNGGWTLNVEFLEFGDFSCEFC